MAKSNLNKYVVVTWEDAWHNGHGYMSSERIHKETPLILESIGYCIRDNKDGVSMGSTIPTDTEGGITVEYRHVQHIPRAMVRKVRVLR